VTYISRNGVKMKEKTKILTGAVVSSVEIAARLKEEYDNQKEAGEKRGAKRHAEERVENDIHRAAECHEKSDKLDEERKKSWNPIKNWERRGEAKGARREAADRLTDAGIQMSKHDIDPRKIHKKLKKT
jgi:hypothetical protein